MRTRGGDVFGNYMKNKLLISAADIVVFFYTITNKK